MSQDIIPEEYKEAFFDDKSYPPSTGWMLKCLAATIVDEGLDWRPTMTGLIELIPKNDFGKSLIMAGHAYGAGKQIKDQFPASAILLFCSAINALGEAPQIELTDAIDEAEHLLDVAGIAEEESIKLVLLAAKERARFDKVSKMMRDEFREGLRRTGIYNDEQVDEISRKIVSIGHQARHDALVSRQIWGLMPISDIMIFSNQALDHDQDFWESFLMKKPEGYTMFGTGPLSVLAGQAQRGCANAILRRLEELRRGTNHDP